MRGMSRSRGPMKPTIDRYQAMDAANTIARAREHLSNPKMMDAVKKHLGAMNDAISGGLKPKPVKPKRLR